jgi:hypothetical protein
VAAAVTSAAVEAIADKWVDHIAATFLIMKDLTRRNVEALRGELIHMILFSTAWALIGEYLLNFRDYFLGGGIILLVVVYLALYSIKLFNVEDSLRDKVTPAGDAKEIKRDRSYMLIFVFEGVAIMLTWILLLKFHHKNWLISGFALIAGLHFFPLARVIRQNAYYFLGAWICILAIAGYLLLTSGIMAGHNANTLVAYGCAAGAAADGVGIMMRTRVVISGDKSNIDKM